MGGTLNYPRSFHFTIEDQICLQKLLKALLRAEHLHLLVIWQNIKHSLMD